MGLPREFQWEPFTLLEGSFVFKYEYVYFLGSRDKVSFSSSSFLTVIIFFFVSPISSLMCWMKEETRLRHETFAGHLREWLLLISFYGGRVIFFLWLNHFKTGMYTHRRRHLPCFVTHLVLLLTSQFESSKPSALWCTPFMTAFL